jgi:hypothetical protein
LNGTIFRETMISKDFVNVQAARHGLHRMGSEPVILQCKPASSIIGDINTNATGTEPTEKSVVP